MNQITKDFFASSSIPQNQDTVDIMDFLSDPESVNKMLIMSEVGLPALTGVVKHLEEQFGNCKLFPLNHEAKDSNAPNRRNIGWMVRFVMKAYGYTPISKELTDSAERTRIGKFADSKFFGTSAVYSKTISNPRYKIVVMSV
ncbi:MAG: hypothetical protein K0R19_1778 [Bacillota bacterium]|jgi:hypothetical protein|nr:hypothetical protein [Bacillota bacterium]